MSNAPGTNVGTVYAGNYSLPIPELKTLEETRKPANQVYETKPINLIPTTVEAPNFMASWAITAIYFPVYVFLVAFAEAAKVNMRVSGELNVAGDTQWLNIQRGPIRRFEKANHNWTGNFFFAEDFQNPIPVLIGQKLELRVRYAFETETSEEAEVETSHREVTVGREGGGKVSEGEVERILRPGFIRYSLFKTEGGGVTL